MAGESAWPQEHRLLRVKVGRSHLSIRGRLPGVRLESGRHCHFSGELSNSERTATQYRTASVSERPLERGVYGRSLTLAVLCRRPRSSTSTSRTRDFLK